jgi:hypothetical protein
MRRLPLRALPATALAACALGFAASADASPTQLTTVAREPIVVIQNDAGADVAQSSIRDVDTAPASDGSRADSHPNGRASAALMAAFVLAGVAAVLVAAASRVSSG